MENKIKDKPDFIIIGSMKSGTTTLYDDLSNLKSLYLPTDKEPAILTKYTEQSAIKNQYKQHFKGASSVQLCGEASTAYTSMPMYDEEMVERALQLCGNKLRLIMVMRDPVERIYSHLRHDVAGGHIDFKEIDHLVLNDHRYLSISNYPMQLKPWIDAFGKNNIHCISFLQLSKDRVQVVKDVAKFLNLDDEIFTLGDEIRNKSSELRKTISPISVAINSRLYRNYIRPIFPNNIKSLVKNMLLPKVDLPEIKLSNSVEIELRNRLLHIEDEIEFLVGKRIKINDFDD